MNPGVPRGTKCNDKSSDFNLQETNNEIDTFADNTTRTQQRSRPRREAALNADLLRKPLSHLGSR